MSGYIVWWILAAVLVGVELATGTFYLLAVGAAFATGGLVAWLGLEGWVQFGVASIVSIAGVTAAHRWRKGHAEEPQMQASISGRS